MTGKMQSEFFKETFRDRENRKNRNFCVVSHRVCYRQKEKTVVEYMELIS